MPTVSSPAKIARIRGYGADLVVEGELYADALAASEAWIKTSGSLPVHAFDQVETMLGTGTLGCELERQAPDLDSVLIAVGGGGLIGGVAAWYGRRVRVVGVEPEKSPTLFRALEAGRPVDAETEIGGIFRKGTEAQIEARYAHRTQMEEAHADQFFDGCRRHGHDDAVGVQLGDGVHGRAASNLDSQ